MVQMKANVIVVRPFMKSMAPYFTPSVTLFIFS